MQPRSCGFWRPFEVAARIELQTGHENTKSQNNCPRKLQAAFCGSAFCVFVLLWRIEAKKAKAATNCEAAQGHSVISASSRFRQGFVGQAASALRLRFAAVAVFRGPWRLFAVTASFDTFNCHRTW